MNVTPAEPEVLRIMKTLLAPLVVLAIGCSVPLVAGGEDERPRARDVGLGIGSLPAGALNAITDVAGVRVGHVTLRQADGVCTGVTVVLPHGRNLFREKVPAAIVVGNGFGKLVGSTQVAELGVLETPIALTNTLSVFRAADGLVEHTLAEEGNEDVRSVNPVAGETNDGYLNDIRRRAVEPRHVLEAIRGASGGPVREGCVGAGTGTRCFGFKGGIGTSSRRVATGGDVYILGVLVQSNFGGELTVKGVRIGEKLRPAAGPRQEELERAERSGGSCMIVVATDAPLDARQLERIGRRALLGLGATGSAMDHGSGDYVIAFSTKVASVPEREPPLADERLSPFFRAARDATEEAILDSLLCAVTTTGFRGRTVQAIPVERLLELCAGARDGGTPPAAPASRPEK